MSGQIIYLSGFRRFDRSSDGVFESQVDGALQPSHDLALRTSKRTLRLQVARIRTLLDELETFSLARDCHERGVVDQSRDGPEPEQNTQGSGGSQNDPQPDVDGDILERMYQALNVDA